MANSRFVIATDRGVVAVTGADAEPFLQGLVTNDLKHLERLPGIHAGLLSPQGKILLAFMIVKIDGGYLLETAAAATGDLVKRLGLYKLRAKLEIADRSAEYRLALVWGAAAPRAEQAIVFPDPRAEALGWRVLVATADAEGLAAAWRADGIEAAAVADYHAHRIGVGVPEAGLDFGAGEVFPHEANFDRLHGVDFKKGCFVGQEVVSRMQHKTVVRKRIVPVTGSQDLPVGEREISAVDIAIGKLGSTAGRQGLALVRLDRVLEAQAADKPIIVGGVGVSVSTQALALFENEARQRVEDAR